MLVLYIGSVEACQALAFTVVVLRLATCWFWSGSCEARFFVSGSFEASQVLVFVVVVFRLVTALSVVLVVLRRIACWSRLQQAFPPASWVSLKAGGGVRRCVNSSYTTPHWFTGCCAGFVVSVEPGLGNAKHNRRGLTAAADTVVSSSHSHWLGFKPSMTR